MNFHEPDLEDLIQSDLHTEMNKILHQSESTCGENSNVTKGTGTSTAPVHALVLENNSSLPETTNAASRNHNDQVTVATCVVMATEASASAKEAVSTSENLEIILETYTSESDDYPIKREINQPHSEHFALEKFPAIEEEIKKDSTLVEGTETGDLSNLAWLTGLDVQQTLQQSEVTASTAHISESSLNANPTCLPDLNPSNPNAVPYDCIPMKAANASHQTAKKPMMRFTPIQPNIPFEDCQRYQLHHGEPMHRKLHSTANPMNGGRFGMHRGFHPYPPPPYGSSGALFMPENFHHGRIHHQGKKVFPKPVYSYSCLIAMSLRASKTGCLPVSDIYNFMMENFPYFKTAPDGWKNSVRHNLSLNKCFEKVEKPNGSQRKGCLWALNPAKISKMEEEVQKWKRKDPDAIRRSMSNPEELDRELEEIRRSDEEAARRRMLSMSSHGLSMLTPPPPGYHPYMRPGHPPHPNLHPSGTTSLPTTPHHQQRTPQRPPMMQNQGLSSGQPGMPLPTDTQNRAGHPPRQLFNYPADPNSFSHGHPGISSTPNPVMESGSSHLPSLQLASSSSSDSSLLGTLTDTFAKSENDFTDIDLESSLADLSAFQGVLWDDADPALLTHPLVSEVNTFNEGIPPQGPHLHSHAAAAISAMEPGQISEETVSESSDYDPTSRFRGDNNMSYLNGSNNKAAVH